MGNYRILKILRILLVLQAVFSAFHHSAVADPGAVKKTYFLEYIEAAAVEIDGIASENVWKNITRESGFSFPWKQALAPSTVFQGFYTGEYIFFYFDVNDPDLVVSPGLTEHAVAEGDRVELFFSGGLDMEEYFCLEIDSSGRVLDYRASFYRKFDNGWDLEGLRAAGSVVPGGYTVEMAVPTAWFRNSGISSLEQNSVINAGIYRGEFSHTATNGISKSWISWQDPGTENPDFHIPSSLGLFTLGGGLDDDSQSPVLPH